MNDFYQVSKKFGTDKVEYHGYHFFYPHFFDFLRNQKFKMVEIGLGGGGSLNAFQEYFPLADITVMDINKEAYLSERSRIIKGDQSKLEDLDKLIQTVQSAELIIDDGSHNPLHQFDTFTYLFKNLLKPGGVYIIEDIEASYWHPESTLYGYKSGYFNLIDGFKKFQEMINSEFTGIDNHLDISTVTYGQNCIIITKRTIEEKGYFDRTYRFSNSLKQISSYG